MPGVLVIEAMAQLAGIVAAPAPGATPEISGTRPAVLPREHHPRPVPQADRSGRPARAHATCVRIHGGLAEFRCEAVVDGDVAADATLTIAF